jgi:hypothetical protein
VRPKSSSSGRTPGQSTVSSGGSVNGTFLRRGGELGRVSERAAPQDGDVVCVLASVSATRERRYFELAFHAKADSQATRAVPFARPVAAACLTCDPAQARLTLVRDGERHEVQIRAQPHRLVRYMVERNAASGGAPALCTHEELMQAVSFSDGARSARRSSRFCFFATS